MRRIAAVFSSSKRDKTDSSQSSSQNPAQRRSYSNLSLSKRKSVKASLNTANLTSSFDSSTPPTPQLSAGQSSASSTGSASLQTHEDVSLPYHTRKGKGMSWLPWNKSGTIKRQSIPPAEATWSTSPPPLPVSVATSGLDVGSETSESDEEVEEDDEDLEFHHSPNGVLRSLEVLQAMLQTGLQYHHSSPPFVEAQGVPTFPRSCHSSRTLRRHSGLEIMIHRQRLLRRLQDSTALTRREEESILPLRLKKVPPVPAVLSYGPLVDEVAPKKTDKILPFSPGLRRWVDRPPFEERLQVWLPVDGNYIRFRVSSEFAVAALEFSEFIEAMADAPLSPETPYFVRSQTWPSANPSADASPSPSLPQIVPSVPNSSERTASAPELTSVEPPSPSPTVSSVSLVSPSKSAPQIMVSSPLRNETETNRTGVHPPMDTEVPAASLSSPTAKRGVRFAEDDKEDNIPIGYVMRIKKQKVEKARFLQEQKDRRKFEEERRRQEDERKQREQERAEWEREKRAWEREKRMMEEERKARLYADQFTASRQRAEDSRHWSRGSSSSTSLQGGLSTPLREDPKRYSRLPHDGAPQSSRNGHETASSSPHSSSPASSRPPSVVGPSGSRQSRPSSFYSTQTSSSDDIRQRERPSRERSSTAPVVAGGQLNLLIPPVPPMPSLFPTDMPLLPPSAPFMMNSYPRSQSKPRSSSASSSRSQHRNGSTDSLNAPHSRSGSSPGPRHSHASHSQESSTSSHRPTHSRRPSHDSTSRQSHTSNHPRVVSTPPQSFSRGRQPQYAGYNVPMMAAPMMATPMIPSPWTGAPSQTGFIPTAMPYHHSTHGTRTPPVRRQTALS